MNEIFRPEMRKIVPQGKKGVAEIRHREVTEQEASFGNLRAAIHRRHFEMVTPGTFCQLWINGALVMSDTDMEWRTNLPFLHAARGRVLIGGLGIGFILVPLLRKPEVESVTVVEKHQDVIDLVLPYVAQPTLTVKCGDIHVYRKQLNGDKFDSIYFDIWPGLCWDNLAEMKSLEASYRSALNRKSENRWIGSWGKAETRAYA